MTQKQSAALRKLKRLKHKRENVRYYIKMQRRGPSYIVNGKRRWPYDVIPILFHTEEEAWLYMEMVGGNLFANSGSTKFRKGKWKSASVERKTISPT